MSIELIVTRRIDRTLRPTGQSIGLMEWIQLVDADPALKMRSTPRRGMNPASGEGIVIGTGPADSEVQIQGEWVPFLRYREGELTMRFTDDLLDPNNTVRGKIAAVAAHSGP
ncbi:MAG: hypothetical protein K2Y71_10870 [Xanthobacteraceae bacterium]|nr:hypothetical protein [Xanthobacteraceae bacterium]